LGGSLELDSKVGIGIHSL